ncbi:MAG: hypothetical protein ACRECQ_12615, partial [Burkholderiaceae bacterium]
MKWPRQVKWIARFALGLLLIALASMAAIWWMYTTSSGLRFVVALNSRLNTSVVVRDVSGSLRDGFTAGSLSVNGPTWSLQATDVVVDPYELHWRRRAFDFERVSARTVAVDWVSGNEPASAPQSLAFPIDLRVRELNIGELQAGARGTAPTVINSIAGSARLNADEIVIERGAFGYGPSRVTLNGRVNARSPFPLQAEARVTSVLQEQDVSARVRAGGTLLDTHVQIDAEGKDANLKATTRLTPFAPVPLAQLSADIAQFNPAAWIDGAPTMRLRGSADLKPVSG